VIPTRDTHTHIYIYMRFMMVKMTTSMTVAKTIRSFARYVHRNNGLQWTDNYFDAKGSSYIIENVSKHLSDFNSIFSLYTRCILSRGKGLAPLRLSTAVLRRHMLKHR